MNIKKDHTGLIKRIFEYILVLIAYDIFYTISLKNNFYATIIIIIIGISSYFYFAVKDEHNFLNFKAIFSGVWLCTIGLAQMRFNAYQQIWISYTWLNLAVAHIAFLVGNDLAYRYFPFFNHFNFKKLNISKFPFYYEFHPNRLFWISVITSLIGIVCFIINIKIKGYIPYFTSVTNTSAYFDFYTRFHIFVVSSMVSGGLAYYCIRKYNITKIKKVILALIIFVMIFVIPILLVQRGTFIIVALILMAVIYLISNRRSFLLLLSCLLVIFTVYQIGSELRRYTDQQLSDFFTPQDVSISLNGLFDDDVIVKLPPKLSYLYCYFTVSQDNFNYIVVNKQYNTWGIRQLIPFNAIIRSQALNNKINNSENYTVRPYLNTYNLIAYAYYDFGISGVVVLTCIWSFAFGLVEQFHKKYKGPFSALAYGICLSPVALCFFNPWMSYFTTWMLWGTVFIMFLFASFTFKKKN